MKKGWKDEAVSPVIATILMVAITVVLAAVLYVMVIKMPANSGTADLPMGLVQQSRNGTSVTVLVVSAPNGALISNSTLYIVHDGQPTPANATLYRTDGTPFCTYADSSWSGVSGNATWESGMQMVVSSAAVSHGDEIILTGIGFGTTNFVID